MDISKKLPTKIPIFPLSNFIVFPDTTVPLNIFEKRYLQMVDDSMTSNRLIGMIQPRKTSNSENPDLFDIGCLCKITSFNETEDGRYIIILKGISRFKKIEEIKNKKLYRELNVSYELFDTDKKLDIKDFEYSDLKKILLQLKVLFEKRGYQINWKDLESQDVYQTLSALSMASPFSIQEKQMLLETKNLKDRKTKFEEILKTYNTDFYNSKTIQ
tara:strand:+ start:1713 stop:2357 length:645 start_codon:yes stop_codon:yes gene_type:complete